jgi:hypothetical protein
MTLDPHPFRPDQLLRELSVILAANTAGKQSEMLNPWQTGRPLSASIAPGSHGHEPTLVTPC